METQDSHVNSDETKDPGAATYGNFINYYTFNPPENRLGLIPEALLENLGLDSGDEPVLMLDVGCNSGDLSVALYKHLLGKNASGSKLHLLGFDLDQDLILRAEASNPFPRNIQFIPLDITDDAESQICLSSYLEKHKRSRFHLCTCFAVTMWVHLNHGDTGFKSLLARLASLSDYLLLEAQPWKCYRSAARRLRKLGRSDFDHFKALEIRGDMAAHAGQHLEKHCSMELMQSFGNTSWDRSLLLFRRR
ncbi:hypothetical protein DNTS_026657 [Danionella cerebrum]|uniref:RNA methyltransferase n=1 Tax=Danionella cerebrum TaxID=2873325 RepID=A0A553P8U8_9TELE|nr:hypothetical protein DNTS_026657 [Danionella translucida]